MEAFWTEHHRRKREGGFTLVELMVVVVILGVLALIAIASYHALTGRAAWAACLSNQRTLNGALQIYRADNGGSLPSTFDDLSEYANTWEIIRKCPLDGRDLRYESESGSIVCPNHVFP